MQLKSLVLTAAAVAALPEFSGAPRPGSPESIKNLKDKIKNVVIMVMENRSFDNLMGGQTLAGLENPNETLWLITFDETGGFHDHTTPTGRDYTFAFDRLGGRMPTWLVSPWARAAVEQRGVNACGKTVSYRATSMLRTLGYLWGFAPYNPRVRDAPSFDHLIGTELRTDAPETFPTVSHFRW
ncbi:hypothetical protein MY1884_005445 [Beauveria asiatica]